MPQTAPPTIEIMPGPRGDSGYGAFAEQRRTQRRIGLFFLVLVIALAASLGYTFARTPVYQSIATLLVVPPNGQTAGSNAPLDHTAIQRQLMADQLLLGEVYERVANGSAAGLGSRGELREMMAAAPVEDTNMIELRAEGGEPAFLQRLVNAWVDAYLAQWSASREASVETTADTLAERLGELEQSIVAKRTELAAFRETHDVVSMQRDENQVLAKLKGLTQALGKSSEEQAAAEARYRAVKAAADEGKPVMGAEEKRSVADLEGRAAQLRSQIAANERKYTQRYIALDPNMRVLPEQLAIVERAIADKREQSQRNALANAEQRMESAREKVQNLERELARYKRTAQQFSARFSEHAALQRELEELEELRRNLRSRLVKTQIQENDPEPQLQLLGRASLPERPIRPQYLRDAGISIGGSLLLAILAVWLHEYLTRPARATAVHESRTVFYNPPTAPALNATERQPELARTAGAAALEYALPRELTVGEVNGLLQAADPATQALIGALLAGVSIEEVQALRWTDVATDEPRVTLTQSGGRTVHLPATVAKHLRRHRSAQCEAQDPVWPGTDGEAADRDELAAMITCAAHDGGLSQPHDITPEALRHTYIAFLVRQGVRLGALDETVGHLSNSTRAGYGRLSPAGPGRALAEIETVYPALANVA